MTHTSFRITGLNFVLNSSRVTDSGNMVERKVPLLQGFSTGGTLPLVVLCHVVGGTRPS